MKNICLTCKNCGGKGYVEKESLFKIKLKIAFVIFFILGMLVCFIELSKFFDKTNHVVKKHRSIPKLTSNERLY